MRMSVYRPVAVLFLLSSLFCGCGIALETTEKIGIGASLVKLPVTLSIYNVNDPLSDRTANALLDASSAVGSGVLRLEAMREERESENLKSEEFDKYFDTFDDLAATETIVIVCMSGGGARAACLAAHAMALLEKKYNKIVQKHRASLTIDPCPMLDRINAYSTVSGGSLYAYQVGEKLRKMDSDSGQNTSLRLPRFAGRQPLARTTAFQQINQKRWPKRKIADLGFWSSIRVFSPVNMACRGITNWSYLHCLAAELAGNWFFRPQMQDLPPSPRFYFNTTCLETGLPFILTQRIVHLPSDPGPENLRLWSLPRTARLDLETEEQIEETANNAVRPFRHAHTLEEIKSSPAMFPVNFAAAASAAFPFASEPLQLRVYGLRMSQVAGSEAEKSRRDRAQKGLYESLNTLHLTDGGIFDNSGLVTAVDLFEYLARTTQKRPKRVKRLILLSINAEISQYDSEYPRKTSSLRSFFDWLDVKWPIDILVKGGQSIDLAYFNNKRRVEKLAIKNLNKLKDELGIEYLHFPVNLTQLSIYDRYQIRPCVANDDLFLQIQSIETDFVISPADDALLAEAAQRLVTTDQESKGQPTGNAAWPVHPEGLRNIGRLDEAFAYALLRAQLPNWNDELLK